jgi:hypothetical protein
MPPSPARWKRASTVEAAILAAGEGGFQPPVEKFLPDQRISHAELSMQYGFCGARGVVP